MENFINNEKFINNIEHFDNDNINTNQSLNKVFTSEYISGLWTTPGTTLDKEEFANGLMEIELKDKKGFIQCFPTNRAKVPSRVEAFFFYLPPIWA